MKKLYDLAVKTGSYSSKDGNEKGIWFNVGSIWEGNDKTQFMLLRAAFNPAAIERKNGSDCISIAMFEPREEQRNGDSKQETHSDDTVEVENEEKIPF